MFKLLIHRFYQVPMFLAIWYLLLTVYFIMDYVFIYLFFNVVLL